MRLVVKIFLLALISLGLYSALDVSYNTWTGTAPCPSVAQVPVCYAVSLGYGLLLAFTLSFKAIHKHPMPFYLGWGIVFGIACLGVSTELIIGDTCPKSEGGIPLCYISFLFCLTILALYLWARKFAKAVHSQRHLFKTN